MIIFKYRIKKMRSCIVLVTAMRLLFFFSFFASFERLTCWTLMWTHAATAQHAFVKKKNNNKKRNRKKRNIVWRGEDLHTYPKAYLLCINTLKVHILSQLRWQLLLYSLCVIILPVTSGNTCALTIKLLGCGFISQFLLKVLKLTCTFLPLRFFFTVLQRAVVTRDWKGKKRRRKK